jgi:hypothetical protein
MPREDEEGYLVDPTDWSASGAEQAAARQGLSRAEDHGFVTRFMRAPQQEHPRQLLRGCPQHGVSAAAGPAPSGPASG